MTRASIVVDGRRVGPYELRYELASGGMATVYLARAPGIGGMPPRAVALKCIHPHLARQSDVVAMFVDEARIAARIQHPHVCTVIDFGDADGTPYLAMEFLRGESIAALQRAIGPTGARLPVAALVSRACRVIADACEGLHAAHELRADDGRPLEIVHRDVTPGNLFLGYDGLVRVVDFGIARAEGRIHQTVSGQLKGTVGYMSPEHLGEDRVDRRADVWSIGVVAWELLTGQRLFRRESDIETMRAITQDTIVPPSRVRAGIAPSVDAAILRALARDRDARWATARELGRALQRASASVGGVAHPADLAEWTEQLFPGRREEKDDLVAATLGRGLRSVGAGSADGSRDEPRSVERFTAPLIAQRASASASASIETAAAETVVDARPPSHASAAHGTRWPALAATAILGAAIGAIAIATWSSRDERAATEGAGSVASSDATVLTIREDQHAARDERVDEPTGDAPTGDEDAIDPIEAVLPHGTGELDEMSARADEIELPDERPRGRGAIGRGFANVSCRGGWAEIYHRGRFVGRTPLRVALPAGRQILELRPFGEAPGRRLVVFVPSEGETTASIAVE
jgi:hypothetical protein